MKACEKAFSAVPVGLKCETRWSCFAKKRKKLISAAVMMLKCETRTDSQWEADPGFFEGSGVLFERGGVNWFFLKFVFQSHSLQCLFTFGGGGVRQFTARWIRHWFSWFTPRRDGYRFRKLCKKSEWFELNSNLSFHLSHVSFKYFLLSS
jgi:hypothetical protein